MLGISKMVWRMALGRWLGQMETDMKEIGKMVPSMAKDLWKLLKRAIQGCGNQVSLTARALIGGKMVDTIQGNMSTAKKKAMENIYTLLEDITKENGKMENNTAKAFSTTQMEQ